MKHKSVAIKYILFCVIATFINLGVQRYFLNINENNYMFFLAVSMGTLAGLVIKYLLDKKWIFQDLNTSFQHNKNTFLLFSTTGIFTTLIFWGTETFFWMIFKTQMMREIGAIIGLFIGYNLKYHLDKNYVFNK